MTLDTDISNAEQGHQEGSKGCGEGEEFPVPLEELKIIRQACDDRLHAAHLMDTERQTHNTHEALLVYGFTLMPRLKCSLLSISLKVLYA